MGTLVDGVFVGRFALATIFLVAGLSKLGRKEDLSGTVVSYGVSASFAPFVAGWLPVGEIALALALFAGVLQVAAAWTAAVALLVFATLVGLNLSRGHAFDCGCGVGGSSSAISWRLVVTDVALAGLAVALAAVNPQRWLTLDVGSGLLTSNVPLSPVPALIGGTVIVFGVALVKESWAARIRI